MFQTQLKKLSHYDLKLTKEGKIMNSHRNVGPKSFVEKATSNMESGLARTMTPMEGVIKRFENNDAHLSTIIEELHNLLTKIRGPVPRNVPVTEEDFLDEQGGLISKMEHHASTVARQASDLSDLVSEFEKII